MLKDRKKAAIQLLECLFWAVSGYGLITGMRLMSGFAIGTKKLIVLLLMIAVAIIIHQNRSRRTPGYLKKVFGLQSDIKRRYEYDWLRIFAVFALIVSHAIQMDLADGMVTNETVRYVLTVIYVFFSFSNVTYVMLSGSLLMPYREEKAGDFYLRRVSRVVLPMFVYFLFYLWLNGELEQITLSTMGDILRRLFQGETPESPHFWLLYVILSIYIVVPFFRYMFKDMPYKMLTAMVGIGWFFMFFTTYIPIPCAVNPILASWIGVAVSGYWITREETRKYDKFIILSGAAGLGITMYCIRTTDNFVQLCCNCSPTMLMISGGIFSMVFAFPKVFSKGNAVLSILGKYSYSLILIHWTVLAGIIRGRIGIHIDQYGYVGGILLSLAVTLFVSFGMVFLIDNMLLVVVEQIYDDVVKCCKLLLERLNSGKHSKSS